jgi:hypothetical protein
MSKSVEHCEMCGRSLVPTNFLPESFKENFNVGDVVTSWSTDKPVTITAIGSDRFLAHDGKRETVCTMRRAWRKLK